MTPVSSSAVPYVLSHNIYFLVEPYELLILPCSQEVQFLMERLNQLVNLNQRLGFLSGSLTSLTTSATLSLMLGKSDSGVELSDLVSVLTGCGNLDRSGPVEIEVTKGEGQMLKIKLTDPRGVHGAEEMRGQYTTLSSVGRSQVEIENTWLGDSFLLN